MIECFTRLVLTCILLRVLKIAALDGNPYEDGQDIVDTSSSSSSDNGSATTTAFVVTMTVLVLFIITAVICFCRGGRTSESGSLVAPLPRGLHPHRLSFTTVSLMDVIHENDAAPETREEKDLLRRPGDFEQQESII